MPSATTSSRKHPKTTFIGAHFASLSSDFDELAKTLDAYPNLFVECGARLRVHVPLSSPRGPRFLRQVSGPHPVRHRQRPGGRQARWTNAERAAAWQEKRALFYSRHLEYFETDHVGLIEPDGTYREWMRLTGVKLPPAVLEKFYHANAEKLIPGLKNEKGVGSLFSLDPAPAFRKMPPCQDDFAAPPAVTSTTCLTVPWAEPTFSGSKAIMRHSRRCCKRASIGSPCGCCPIV